MGFLNQLKISRFNSPRFLSRRQIIMSITTISYTALMMGLVLIISVTLMKHVFSRHQLYLAIEMIISLPHCLKEHGIDSFKIDRNLVFSSIVNSSTISCAQQQRLIMYPICHSWMQITNDTFVDTYSQIIVDSMLSLYMRWYDRSWLVSWTKIVVNNDDEME